MPHATETHFLPILTMGTGFSTYVDKNKIEQYLVPCHRGFFDNLRKEMVNVVREAKEDHDLDRIPATRRYETRMQGKVKRKQLPAGSNMEWRDDAGEYAQRIWQWWKARKDNYPFHGLAIRLVVLAQLSSCSVERVFSKLERIRKATGENMKEDMCEIRLLLQCNGTLDDMYDALVLKWKGD